MAKIIGLPKLSPTMDEGTLVKWVKAEGEEVDVDDLLAEVETDKATMEFRSFDKGVLLKILAPEGETLAAEAPVAIIGKKGEDISKLMAKVGGGAGGGGEAQAEAASAKGVAKKAGEESAEEPAEEPSAEASDEASDEPTEERSDEPTAEPAAAPGTRSARRRGDAGEKRAQGNGQPEAPVRSATPSRVLASPRVRKLAREYELDLSSVEGTGPRGRIVKRDIETHLANGPEAAPRGDTPRGAPTRATRESVTEKASQMRKAIARRLTESKRDVPHYYLTIDIDAEPLNEARATLNAQLEKSGEKVSLNDLVIKAVAMAIRSKPTVNVSWDEGSFVRHGRVDISVAVAVPDGLITPVVRDADQKGILEIAREVRDLAERARAKKLQPEEFTNGTFSISNLGMYGIEEFTAVINPPEGAILAVGTLRKEPVVRGDQIAIGTRMRMTLSCDHRVIDGATGAEWLAHLKRYLEAPLSMLL